MTRMYKKKNNSLNIIVVTVIILAISSLISCKDTPQNEIIINHNQEEFEQALLKKSSNNEREYPSNYYDTFLSKDNNVTITIDSKVIVPEEKKLPVILINPSPISEDMIDWAVVEFLEGKEGFYPIKPLTKSEISDWIVYFQSTFADEDELYRLYETTEAVEIIKESLTKKIEEYKIMLVDAPENVTLIPSHLILRPYDFYVSENTALEQAELELSDEELIERQNSESMNLYLSTDVELSDGSYGRLEVYNEYPYSAVNNGQSLFHMEKYQLHVTYSYIPQYIHRCFSLTDNSFGKLMSFGALDQEYLPLTISEDQAITEAQELLSDIGVENFDFETIRSSYGIDFRFAYSKYVEEMEDEYMSIDEFCKEIGVESKFYKITFKPNYYGIPLLEANQAFYNEEKYLSDMEYEEIMIRVGENKIAEFRWTNPTDVSNVINDNVEIIDFEEAIKNAKNFMQLKFNIVTLSPIPLDAPEYSEVIETYVDGNVIIDEIKLGLAGIPAYNSSGEYLLIPVWNFYGSYSLNSSDDDYDIEEERLRLPILSVNAIDGSIITQQAKITY